MKRIESGFLSTLTLAFISAALFIAWPIASSRADSEHSSVHSIDCASLSQLTEGQFVSTAWGSIVRQRSKFITEASNLDRRAKSFEAYFHANKNKKNISKAGVNKGTFFSKTEKALSPFYDLANQVTGVNRYTVSAQVKLPDLQKALESDASGFVSEWFDDEYGERASCTTAVAPIDKNAIGSVPNTPQQGQYAGLDVDAKSLCQIKKQSYRVDFSGNTTFLHFKTKVDVTVSKALNDISVLGFGLHFKPELQQSLDSSGTVVNALVGKWVLVDDKGKTTDFLGDQQFECCQKMGPVSAEVGKPLRAMFTEYRKKMYDQLQCATISNGQDADAKSRATPPGARVRK